MNIISILSVNYYQPKLDFVEKTPQQPNQFHFSSLTLYMYIEIVKAESSNFTFFYQRKWISDTLFSYTGFYKFQKPANGIKNKCSYYLALNRYTELNKKWIRVANLLYPIPVCLMAIQIK